MKKLLLVMFAMISLVSCKQEIKKVTALVLAENVTAYVINDGIVTCENEQVLYSYVRNKTCEALKADCSDNELNQKIVKRKKSALGKMACETAILIVAPVLFPSNFLPIELKNAGCVATKLDYWLSHYSKKVCDKL